jgi:transposase
VMKKDMEKERGAGSPEGGRSPNGGEPAAAVEVKRWSAGRKREVVLRLLRGESVDAISREVSVPIYKLEQWRDRSLKGIEASLKEREDDPVVHELDAAKRRIGELVMEVEILQRERRARHPLVKRRSSR